MLTRCIHLFPEFENIKINNDIREKIDPLADKIKSHITLVFPFQSKFTKDDLIKHLNESLKNISSFCIKLSKISAVESLGYYLF